MEVVRNAFFKQFFMQGAVDSEEKSSVPQSNMIFSESGRSMSVMLITVLRSQFSGCSSIVPNRFDIPQFIGKGRMSTPPDMLPAAANKS